MINIDEPLINKNSFTLEDISLSSSSSSLSSLSFNDFLNITRLQSPNIICFFYYATICGAIGSILLYIIINIFFL